MKTAGLLIFVGVFATVSAVHYRRLSATRDRAWESRWRALPLGKRRRIAAAVRRGEKFEDPAEAALAAGSARYQRRFVFNGWIATPIASLAVAGVALLGGVFARSVPLMALGLVIVALDAWRMRRFRARREALVRAGELNEAPRGARSSKA